MAATHRVFYQSQRWFWLRRKVFSRDGWRCVLCRRPGRLECDHIRPASEGGDFWDPANLRTVCRGCHIELTRELNRGGHSNRPPPPERAAWDELVEAL